MIAKLRQHETGLRRWASRACILFGSTARGEARPDSDVDLFFGYDPDKLGLRELFRIKDLATEFPGCKVGHHDKGQHQSVYPALRRKDVSSVLMAGNLIPRL